MSFTVLRDKIDLPSGLPSWSKSCRESTAPGGIGFEHVHFEVGSAVGAGFGFDVSSASEIDDSLEGDGG